MSQPVSHAESGFSTIELLVSLFVAAMFIGIGYQLFGVVTRNGTDARLQATASNIAYNNLRQYAAQATNPCTATPTLTLSPTPALPSPSGLPNASITVTATCPYTAQPSITRLQVSIKYGTSSPQQEVDHALYVNGAS